MNIGMKKSVVMLTEKARLISLIASMSLILLVVSLILIIVYEFFFQSLVLEKILFSAFGSVMVMSLVAMIAATYKVVSCRNELGDPYYFLFIIWVVPYVGISVFLGGANILRILRSK